MGDGSIVGIGESAGGGGGGGVASEVDDGSGSGDWCVVGLDWSGVVDVELGGGVRGAGGKCGVDGAAGDAVEESGGDASVDGDEGGWSWCGRVGS